MLVQCEAPQELLLGTDLMPALGIRVNLEDPDCQESTRPEGGDLLTAPANGGTVRLLSTMEVPANSTCLVMAEVAKPE